MNIIEKTYTMKGSLKTRTRTNRIILHHAAAVNCTADDINRWHHNNGWTCIGYHFFVNKEGEIYRGRPENTIGAHSGSAGNGDSIGICFEGNFEIEYMPEAQKQAGKELIAYLKDKYNIDWVQKHKDIVATACPGRYFPFDEIASAKTAEVAPAPAEPTTDNSYLVKVTANCLNIREKAGTQYAITGQITDKGTYTIVETNGNWGKLKSGMGWICLDYTTAAGQTTIVKTKKKMKVNTTAGLNVRSTPGGTKVGALKYGTVVTVTEEKDGWSKIGNNQWVSSQYLTAV